jgi:hypothetical protein
MAICGLKCSSLRSEMFIVYRLIKSQAPSERHAHQNDEIRMPKLEGMSNDERHRDTASSSFALCASFVIRHPCFGI